MKAQHYCSHGEQCPLLRQFFRTFRVRVRVWDNGGYTMDRYTVAIKRQEKGRTVWDVYGMSEYASKHGTGFDQFSHTHTGNTYTMDLPNKRARINTLPGGVLQAISNRI